MGFPPVPAEVKPVAHLMKLADEHESRNIVVAYWARMSACLLALKMTPGKKTPETAALIGQLLDWLEATKKANKDNEAITSETAAQAVIEDYALNLFEFADKQDRAEIFNKNTVKTFYTAGMLFDVLEQFGLSEDLHEKQKYAKWKAAFIHNCLKSGEKPFPGPPGEQNKMLHISELPEEEQRMLEEKRRQEAEEEQRKRAESGGNITPGSGPGYPPVFPAGPSDDFPTFPSFPTPGSNSTNSIPGFSPVSPLVPQQPGSVTPAAPTTPVPTGQPTTYNLPSSSGGAQVTLTPDQIQKAQKYSKYATSALSYDDVRTAVDNLQKALNILQSGKES